MADGPTPPRSDDFARLAIEVREADLLRRRPGYYTVKIGLTVAAFVAGWVTLVLVGNSWAVLGVAVFLGLMFAQLGFVAHDAGHQQVFRSRWANRVLGLVIGNALIGLSFGWWVPKHNAHHAHPNEVGRDPDVGEGLVAFEEARGGALGWLADQLARHQAELFFPLMVLRSAGLHVSGVQQLLRRRDRSSAIEALLVVVHFTLYLTALAFVLSPLRGLVFVVVQQAVFSIYVGCSFAPNHKGMPLVEKGNMTSFLRRQVATARNVTGGRLTAFLLGGLNYQIEHHLFPSMPRPNLPAAQGIVRRFCLSHDLGYREDAIWTCYRQALRQMGEAAALRPGVG